MRSVFPSSPAQSGETAAMGIALTAALLFGVALYQGLTYMPDSDLTTLLIGTTAGFVLFSLILNWAGYCGTAARLGKGER